jgi:hypothetical protein
MPKNLNKFVADAKAYGTKHVTIAFAAGVALGFVLGALLT